MFQQIFLMGLFQTVTYVHHEIFGGSLSYRRLMISISHVPERWIFSEPGCGRLREELNCINNRMRWVRKKKLGFNSVMHLGRT